MKHKVVSKIMVTIAIICAFLVGCQEKAPTSPTGNNNNGSNTENPIPPDNGGGDNGSGDGDNNGGSDNGGDNNGNGDGDGGNNTPNPEPPVFIPQYPNDPGESYGQVYEVVTPKIYLDDTWGTTWKVREKDYHRINYMWGQILATFEGDRIGLAIVFGAAVAFGQSAWKDHADFKKVRPTDGRLYQTTSSNRNYDLRQPFNKYSQDYNTHKFQSTHVAKFWRHAVLVKIENDYHFPSAPWMGKYTIGGVYKAGTRLAYGGEYNLNTAESQDDEIIIIRKDLTWWHNGITYYRVQCLFNTDINNRRDEIRQDKIWSFKDFDQGFNRRPIYSEYIWAIPAEKMTTLQR